jgi:hypothetical protein
MLLQQPFMDQGAANGVVLVTTKQGKSRKMTIQYDGNVGLYKPTKLLGYESQETQLKKHMLQFQLCRLQLLNALLNEKVNSYN